MKEDFVDTGSASICTQKRSILVDKGVPVVELVIRVETGLMFIQG